MTLQQFLTLAAKTHGLELDRATVDSLACAFADWVHTERAQVAISQGMMVEGGRITRNVADSLGAAARASS